MDFHAVFMASRVRSSPEHGTRPRRTWRRAPGVLGEDREFARMPGMDRWLVGIAFGAIVTYEAVSLFMGIAPHEILALRWRRERARASKHLGGTR
ncbi:MAG TPA: hypothetical protein VMT93_04585 [Gemmatimonadaceae bacterium]|nr:hypothetical protein [Gemmatimonadaceae bacterium]